MNVEIEVETDDRTRMFIGTLWESKTNVTGAYLLLEVGLKTFGANRIPEFHLLTQAAEKMGKLCGSYQCRQKKKKKKKKLRLL
uniref:Uncharacterized protein n=1 Tax=Lactuca sativa TaxID=4236 RepID=A0A9R1WRZ4_LACSA|nr:hypothetical protein LSAT_V11C100048420 [Lactuca sativa]